MFKRFLIVLSMIAVLCTTGPVMALRIECSSAAVQEWMSWNGISVVATCYNDTSTDWAIHVNLDNNNPDFDNVDEAWEDICWKATTLCNGSNGADVRSCLIARDNHCLGFNPCNQVWKPHCDATNDCINAMTYCGGYVSTICEANASNCVLWPAGSSGYFGTCQQTYNCGFRSCADTWKPMCDGQDKCFVSYRYCGQYLSKNCRNALVGCAFKNQNSCNYLYGVCGVPVPR